LAHIAAKVAQKTEANYLGKVLTLLLESLTVSPALMAADGDVIDVTATYC
jgi:hypothetical protein